MAYPSNSESVAQDRLLIGAALINACYRRTNPLTYDFNGNRSDVPPLYAGMLGFMNEDNYSADEAANQSTAARKDVQERPIAKHVLTGASVNGDSLRGEGETTEPADTQVPPVDAIQEPSAVVDVAAQAAVAAPRKDAEAAAPDPVTPPGTPADEVAAPAVALSVNPDCLKAQRGEACQFSHKTYCCSECRNVASAKLADARRGRVA